MASEYDLVLMLDPEAPGERRSAIVDDVRAAIESKGALRRADDWGTRKLAYEIRHHAEAEFHLFQFEADGALLDELSHSLKIADGVLRFRTVKLEPGMPPPPEGGAGPRPSETATPVPEGAAPGDGSTPEPPVSESEPASPESAEPPVSESSEPSSPESAEPPVSESEPPAAPAASPEAEEPAAETAAEPVAETQ